MFIKLLKIVVIITIYTASMLFATEISATNNCEAIIADWEYAEDKNINDKLILDNLTSIDSLKVQTKSCSSLYALTKIDINRQKLSKIIEESIKIDKIDEFSKICAKLLEKYAKISINSLTEKENQLIKKIETTKLVKNIISTKQISNEENHNNKLDLFNQLLITAINSHKNNKQAKETTNHKQLRVKYDNHNVNLSKYSIKEVKANYYNLILYIWEDSPNKERNTKTTFLYFSLINESSQNFQTTSTNIDKQKIQNIQTGLTKS